MSVIYGMLLQTGEGYFLMASREGAVQVQAQPGKITRGIENSYDRNHQRGYEASMSACMHYLQFSPTEVALPDDVAALKSMLEGEGYLYTLSAVSGHYYGWKITKEAAEALLGKVKEPRLISEETFEKDFGRGFPK